MSTPPRRHRAPRTRPLLVRVREWLLLGIGIGGIGYERFLTDEPRLLFVAIWLGFIGGPAFVLQDRLLRPLLTRAASVSSDPTNELDAGPDPGSDPDRPA